jgi:hypothetical protein
VYALTPEEAAELKENIKNRRWFQKEFDSRETTGDYGGSDGPHAMFGMLRKEQGPQQYLLDDRVADMTRWLKIDMSRRKARWSGRIEYFDNIQRKMPDVTFSYEILAFSVQGESHQRKLLVPSPDRDLNVSP